MSADPQRSVLVVDDDKRFAITLAAALARRGYVAHVAHDAAAALATAQTQRPGAAVIDLKLGKFTHADAGQIHLYLNYAREHWTMPGENPPVGLVLCAEKDAAVVHYALENLPNKVMTAQYRTTLPAEAKLAAELERTEKILRERRRLLVEARGRSRRPRR